AVRTIQPKPCMNKASGQEGTCMFAWDCFSAGGTHLTYCTDSFYTGSCCKLPPGVVVHQHEMPSDPTNSIDSIADDSDEDYNKKTKKPSLPTAKPTVPMRKTTPQAIHLTKPIVSPQETSQSTPSFGGLSTFTPGLITWRPHETTLATESKAPLISLRQFKRNTFLHKCGAALLNEYWAISAAHCVHNVSPNDIMLRLGEYDLKSEREQLPHVERRIQIVATHPRFDASTFEYDLALLRFYEAIPFKDNVLPVCVPDTNDSYVGRNAVVTGWGRLYEGT
ncbi:hypothetical protein HPB47_007829, partial [Ixodes persulcatus]